MPNVLQGQVAVVTGSTQGIGAGIAKLLAAEGSQVVVHGLDAAAGERVVAAIQASQGVATLLAGDLQQEAHCRQLIQHALKTYGRIDILVNNAGIYTRGDLETTSVELWDRIFAINLRAPFILCQEAVRSMRKQGGGCIVNIGSVNAYIGGKKLLPYSASKGGLMTFTRNLANYLAPSRIRVNQINPGWVLTEGEHLVESIEEGRGENWLDVVLPTRPFGRMLYPEDIAQAVLFFASNPLLTGAVIDYEQVPVGALPEV